MRASPLTACLVLAIGLSGCGSSPAMRAAERGDYAALRSALAVHRGEVSRSEVADLARAVVARELSSGRDPLARVREVRACAYELDDPLSDRMKTHDAAGGAAALARVDAGALDPGGLREYASDPDAGWRAAATRALTREKDRAARQKAMLDVSPLVRRQALRAAAEADDVADYGAIAEAARLDPEPVVRAEAVRALARRESPRTANVLRDLWDDADDELREDIALAWAAPKVFSAGGRDALLVRIAADHGPGALRASSAVLRVIPRDAAAGDRELTQSAIAQVLRALEHGTRAERMQAIAIARPEDPGLGQAIVSASKGEDPEVRVSALGRLTESKEHREAAIRELEAVAKGGDPQLAARARFLLAAGGEERVAPLLEASLGASAAAERLEAVNALAALGKPGRGVRVLADQDPSVRTQAACALLLAKRR